MKPAPGKPRGGPAPALILLALLYAAGAIPAAWNVIAHSQASTRAIEAVFERHDMRNEAEQSLDRYVRRHPILGTLFAPPVKGAFDLPSSQQATQALDVDVPRLVRTVERESSAAAWWSWFLVGLGTLYAASVIAWERRFAARAVLAALSGISLVSFVVGVLAPAMIIWTAPTIPIESDNLKFVLQHEVRGIAAVIRQLFGAGHWIIAGFLFLFSIATPLAKTSLTLFVAASRSLSLNRRIGLLLHSIGKWSMADVCVAGVLLALYALKFQEATHSIPCIGLAYFIGYCLLSMTTTELLVHSEAAGGRRNPGKRLGPRAVAALFAVALGVVAAAGLYTWREYPLRSGERDAASSLPQKLNRAGLASPSPK